MDVYLEDFDNALRDALTVKCPPDREIGGIIVPRGLIELPNILHNRKTLYAPDLDTVSASLMDAPMLGLWHTHSRNTRPAYKDHRLVHEIWKAGGVALLVITPRRLFLLTPKVEYCWDRALVTAAHPTATAATKSSANAPHHAPDRSYAPSNQASQRSETTANARANAKTHAALLRQLESRAELPKPS